MTRGSMSKFRTREGASCIMHRGCNNLKISLSCGWDALSG